MQCKYCAYQIKPGVKICPNCGRSVSLDSEGMRHDDGVIYEKESDYKKQKPRRHSVSDSHDNTDADKKKMSTGLKAVIIIAVVILIAAGATFFLFKGGYLDSLLKKNGGAEESSAPQVVQIKEESSTQPDEENTGANAENEKYKTGYYKVTKSNGAAMFESNRIYSESTIHIAAQNTYVEIKAFEYTDSYVLGFACENGKYYGWLKMSDVEYADGYTPQQTAAATTERTTVKPAETTAKPAETTASQSVKQTGRYTVSDSVGDNLNVRKGPGTDYDVVKSLDIGSNVTVIEWDGNWAHISVNGEDAGYVYGEYIEKE